MKYWNIYTSLVKRNCTNPSGVKDLGYWRDNLFSGTLIYLLPFCFIALLPALYLVFITGQYMIAVIDLGTLTSMAVVAFVPGIKLLTRKIVYISFVYAFSCAQLFYLGLYGPGLLYLLIASIFSILIFPTKYRFWPAWINTIISFLFAVAISQDFISWPASRAHTMTEWVAMASNLIFLSFLASALIPQLFNGLQESLDKEKQLREELNTQQDFLKQASDMLQQKNNELEQFAYVASHDLKEPLRMVTNFMGLLKSKYGAQLDEKAHVYIDYALDGGKRMQKMVGDLLELSRTANQYAVKERINLNEIFNEVRQNIFRLIEENQATIIVKTQLPILPVYRVDITRLLQNLLSNAIKFRKKDINPVITVEAIEKEDEWLFNIEDNGIGIEAEKFDRIFEIFARLHSQANYEGSGIGLAVCKKVVEHHGGTIWIESKEGSGSTFYFTIKK